MAGTGSIYIVVGPRVRSLSWASVASERLAVIVHVYGYIVNRNETHIYFRP